MNGLTAQEKKLIQLLPNGGEHPRDNQFLALMLDTTPRNVRAMVFDLVTKHGFPIGSSHQKGGYYWITTEEERTEALAPLNSQIGEMMKRATATANNELITKDQALETPIIFTSSRKPAKEAPGQLELI